VRRRVGYEKSETRERVVVPLELPAAWRASLTASGRSPPPAAEKAGDARAKGSEIGGEGKSLGDVGIAVVFVRHEAHAKRETLLWRELLGNRGHRALMASISSAIDPVVSRMNASSIDFVATGVRSAVRCKTSKLSSPCVERTPSALPSAHVARTPSESPTRPTASGKMGVRPDGIVRGSSFVHYR